MTMAPTSLSTSYVTTTTTIPVDVNQSFSPYCSPPIRMQSVAVPPYSNSTPSITSQSYLPTVMSLPSGLTSYISTAPNGVPMWCGATVVDGTTSCITVLDAVITACEPANTVVIVNNGTTNSMPLCGPGLGPAYTPNWSIDPTQSTSSYSPMLIGVASETTNSAGNRMSASTVTTAAPTASTSTNRSLPSESDVQSTMALQTSVGFSTPLSPSARNPRNCLLRALGNLKDYSKISSICLSKSAAINSSITAACSSSVVKDAMATLSSSCAVGTTNGTFNHKM